MNNTDKWWKNDIFEKKLPYLKQRAKIVETIRRFFTQRDFIEVETSVLQISPGLEPHLKAFETALIEPFSQKSERLYLHTSPEFAMKKLLVAGLPKIFQMARVFRNEERASHHHPEFVMLEWYRANEDYRFLMTDTVDLVRSCAKACDKNVLTANGGECDIFCDWEYLSVHEAFLRYTGIDIFSVLPNEPSLDPDPSLFKKEAEKIGVHVSDNDRWDDVYFRIVLDFIEPKLGEKRPTILYDYPVCMAALSRKKPEDPRLAERFEVYVRGVELANAFSELTDAKEQTERFNHDMDLKEKLYAERYPIDPDFIDALEYGMPESTGIAVGVDRLVMLITGAKHIDDVIWTPVA